MITMNETMFCIKVVVTGKGNLRKPCQRVVVIRSGSAREGAYLYVPTNVRETVSADELDWRLGALHESVNLSTTSKPESALTAAIAKRPVSNCRSIAQVNFTFTRCYSENQRVSRRPNFAERKFRIFFFVRLGGLSMTW